MPSTTLRYLWDRFSEAIIVKSNGERFLPDSKLFDILEGEDVNLEQCLREGDIEEVDREEVLSLIMNGAQRLFTILVLMQGHPVKSILKFIRRDQMLENSLDARLPFSLRDLKVIFKQSKNLANHFDQLQWQVLSPVFKADRSHRELKAKTVLPIISEELIPDAKGGFGIVSSVVIHEAHHYFDQMPNSPIRKSTLPITVARKQIFVEGSYVDTSENERRIMRLLRLLHHENMAQLLASYSIFGADGVPQNFLLMPLADMSLTKVLKLPERGKAPSVKTIFGNETTLLCELHGVSSALDQLHHYEYHDGSLCLKGCHFDLDPRNILVQAQKLLLADFGLSRLKSESADSCTPYHGGGASHYTAPECLSAEEPEYHGSKSDMWSLGGIIYDLVAWMIGGVKMVKDFQEKRKHKAGGIISCRFHIGGASLNSEVEIWVTDHWATMNRNHRSLCDLAKRMLAVEPTQRPDSTVVAERLLMIAVLSQFRDVDNLLANLAKASGKLRPQLERTKLRVWAHHAGLSDEPQADMLAEQCWLQKASRNHLLVKDLLRKAKAEIETLEQVSDLVKSERIVFASLQDICDRLWSIAPHTCRISMARDLELEIMNLPDIAVRDTQLPMLNQNLVNEGFSEDESQPLRLAALRKFNQNVGDLDEALDSQSSVHILNEASIEIPRSGRQPRPNQHNRKEWSLVSLKDSQEQFLCEWVHYEAEIMDIDPQRLHRRVRSIVRQLSAAESHSSLNALPCNGYFVRKSESAFGIVFSLPSSRDQSIEPMTLNQFIRYTERPSLTEILHTAKAIAKNIFYFHGLSWVHKNVSSYSVVLFDESFQNWITQKNLSDSTHKPTKAVKSQPQPPIAAKPVSNWPWVGKSTASRSGGGKRSDSDVKIPSRTKVEREDDRDNSRYPLKQIPSHYIVGFNHSRVDDKLTFTTGQTGPWYEYQHFRYANQTGQLFQAGFDYYSLGLVLLELGLWTPVDRISVLEQGIGNYALDRLQSLLYEKAVAQLNPLVGDRFAEAVRICLSDELLDIDRTEVERIFSKEVLARLESCSI